MNKKLLKILTGFSAIAVAGVLSVIPANNVFAGQYSGSSICVDHQIDVNSWTDIEVYDANLLYEYSGTGSTNVVNYFSVVDYLLDNSTMFFSFLEFDSDLPEGATGNVDFDFILDGVHYRGSVALTERDNQELALEGWEPFDLSSCVLLEGQPSDEFYNSINTTADDIIKAAQGINHDGSENPEKVVFYNCNGAINYRIINALAKAQGVTLFYTFEYEGYVFTSAITSEMASQILIEGEDWYGCCYIAKHCPTIPVDVVK